MPRIWKRPALQLLVPLLTALTLGLLWRCGGFAPPPDGSARPGETSSVDDIVADMRRRFAAKQEVVRELLAGRSTLKQAVAYFRRHSTSHLVDGAKLSEESVCGDVLIHAEYLLRENPPGTPEALASLHRQVRDHLAGR